MSEASLPERAYERLAAATADDAVDSTTLRGQQDIADRLTYQVRTELDELGEVLSHHLRPDDRQPGPKLVDEADLGVDRVPLSPAATHARQHAVELNRLLDTLRVLRARVDI